jgi:hypothetical protein
MLSLDTTVLVGGERSLRTIAREISRDWRPVYFGAVPYLEALHSLDNVRESYGDDDARSIVLYFLGNAQTWRGPVARRIKLELKALLKARK